MNAEIDPFASDGKLLANKLRVAGVMTKRELYTGVTHEVFGMDAAVAAAAKAQDFAAQELKAAFAARVSTAK